MRGEDLATVRLRDHLCELCAQLERGLAHGEIQVECDVPDVTASADTAIHLAIIVNELVTNALKHAFQDGGKGRVQVVPAGPDKVTHAISIMEELTRLASLDPHWSWSSAAVVARGWSGYAQELFDLPTSIFGEESVVNLGAIAIVLLLLALIRPIRPFTLSIALIAVAAVVANSLILVSRGLGTDSLPEKTANSIRVMTWNTAGDAVITSSWVVLWLSQGSGRSTAGLSFSAPVW